MKSIRTGF